MTNLNVKETLKKKLTLTKISIANLDREKIGAIRGGAILLTVKGTDDGMNVCVH